MKKTNVKKGNKADVKVDVAGVQEQVAQAQAEQRKLIAQVRAELPDVGHSSKYVELYQGIDKTLAYLAGKGQYKYDESLSCEENSVKVAKAVSYTGFKQGFLVKKSPSKQSKIYPDLDPYQYSPHTLQDVIACYFMQLRGIDKTLSKLTGSNPQDKFLDFTACSKHKASRVAREMSKEEEKALEGLTQNNVA